MITQEQCWTQETQLKIAAKSFKLAGLDEMARDPESAKLVKRKG